MNFKHISKLAKPTYTYEIGGILYFLGKMMNAKTTIEIGVKGGYTSLLLGKLADENNGKHYAVDISKKWLTQLEINATTLSIKNIIFVNEDSGDIDWRTFEHLENTIDLAFIDGDHSYKAVKQDIRQIADAIRVGGILAFHDYYDFRNIGVKKAVDEMWNDNWEQITIPYERGLVLWRKK